MRTPLKELITFGISGFCHNKHKKVKLGKRAICEIGGLKYCLSCAHQELAMCESNRGIISKDFTQQLANGILVHGNELFSVVDSEYPCEQYRDVSQHSIDNIVNVLSKHFPIDLPQGYSFPEGIENSVDLFLGYLLLDAVIGNTDRHHENWGVLVSLGEPKGVELAPTFDHASSMGRELTEEGRQRLLEGKGYKANIESYAMKAKSAIYIDNSAGKPLSTFNAFVEFSKHASKAKKVWLDKLTTIEDDIFNECIIKVPKQFLSKTSKEFVYQLLMCNKGYLLSL